MTRPNDDWSVFYTTPVQRLLYRCGLKIIDIRDGKDIWSIRRLAQQETE